MPELPKLAATDAWVTAAQNHCSELVETVKVWTLNSGTTEEEKVKKEEEKVEDKVEEKEEDKVEEKEEEKVEEKEEEKVEEKEEEKVEEKVEEKEDSNQTTYTYEQLLSKPAGCDVTSLESYLSDAEFQTVFGKTREEFQKLAKWKQQNEKKRVNLF
eukprot:TRINITY_DN388_c0_g1_i1.p1 TRINITY_DN388_c0_g1~~TRINITY_DN388_c0_g1_i1.p1  ORF type:complete len:174 (+),score=111.11 TRINITY_DN388_c0_g1_i1:54-524(+)